MLDRSHRLTSSTAFAEAVRRGRRAGSSLLVVHLRLDPSSDPDQPPRVGFVVGKAVGGAVTRNLVKRRLRHLTREHLAELPGGSVLVVRALGPAGQADHAELGETLGRLLRRVTRDGASG